GRVPQAGEEADPRRLQVGRLVGTRRHHLPQAHRGDGCMTRTAKVATEETVSNGARSIGRIVPRLDKFELFNGDGQYLWSEPTLPAARAALHRYDQDRQALQRLEDDGGSVAA